MARALVRLGSSLGLASSLALVAPALWAQAGDVIEEDSAPPEEEAGGDDQDDESSDDSGDGDWSSEGGGSGESGLHFGLRLAWGFLLGKATGASTSSTTTGGTTTTTSYGGGKMSDSVAGQIPIWLDLGWQFSPAFMAGLYFSYGFVLPGGDLADACDEDRASCTLSDIRLGVQAQLSLAPGRGTDPWLGAGLGYEWFSIDINDASATLRGPELLLQGGIDFGGDSGGSTIGPFVGFTFGQFSQASFKFGSISDSGDIDETAMHNWLFIGVRGVVK